MPRENGTEEKKSTSPSLYPRTKTSVRFGRVDVREYELTLGDNPSCSNGPPLTLDWSYQNIVNLPLADESEGKFGCIGCKDRHRNNGMGISENKRIELLLAWGHTYEEIMQAEMIKLKHQLLRERTLGNLKSVQKENISHLFESIRMKYAVRKASHNQIRGIAGRAA
mmetsp:Transcript_17467/g.23337  ORF Transcript_17467/g.23337 Transcript_17467/m.23337 type:complete len:167 (-) Transcript_17467:240-740(-)